jgi:hypothetical protein
MLKELRFLGLCRAVADQFDAAVAATSHVTPEIRWQQGWALRGA